MQNIKVFTEFLTYLYVVTLKHSLQIHERLLKRYFYHNFIKSSLSSEIFAQKKDFFFIWIFDGIDVVINLPAVKRFNLSRRVNVMTTSIL